MSLIQLVDNKGNQLPFINIRLGANGQTLKQSYDDKFTNHQGNTAWPNPILSNQGYDLYVNLKEDNINPRYAGKIEHIDNFNFDSITIDLKTIPVKLEKLKLRSKRLYTASDKSYFIKGETGFLDYFRFLRGENIRPLLEQSNSLGSNCRRNFLMTMNTGVAAGIGPCNPENFGNDFYDKFPVFLELYKEYELYGYFSVFPDNGLFNSWANQTSKQVNHWNRLGAIASNIDNVFAFELTNEFQAKQENNVDRNAFNKISNLLCCSGSYGESSEGNRYPPPYFDFGDYHSPRSYPNEVKDCNVANNPNYLAGEPTLLGEPLGFGSTPNRERNPVIAREMAGSAISTGIGIFYHSQNGGFSQLYDEVEMPCAIEWFGILK